MELLLEQKAEIDNKMTRGPGLGGVANRSFGANPWVAEGLSAEAGPPCIVQLPTATAPAWSCC